MSDPTIARQSSDSSAHNTINIPTAKIFFQQSPGVNKGDQGVEGLEYQVTSLVGGKETVIQPPRKTNKEGLATVPIPGESSQLQLLHLSQVVARYDVVIDPAGLDQTVAGPGVEQRLQALGYQMGQHGPSEDGVNAPEKERYEFERSLLDFQADEEVRPDANALDNSTLDRLIDEIDKLNSK